MTFAIFNSVVREATPEPVGGGSVIRRALLILAVIVAAIPLGLEAMRFRQAEAQSSAGIILVGRRYVKAAVGANTDIFAAGPGTSTLDFPATSARLNVGTTQFQYRVIVQLGGSSTFNATLSDGTTTKTVSLGGGTALSSGIVYYLACPAPAGGTIDFQTGSNVAIDVLQVEQVKDSTTIPSVVSVGGGGGGTVTADQGAKNAGGTASWFVQGGDTVGSAAVASAVTVAAIDSGNGTLASGVVRRINTNNLGQLLTRSIAPFDAPSSKTTTSSGTTTVRISPAGVANQIWVCRGGTIDNQNGAAVNVYVFRAQAAGTYSTANACAGLDGFTIQDKGGWAFAPDDLVSGEGGEVWAKLGGSGTGVTFSIEWRAVPTGVGK